ncbi:hypothetical protein NPIL_89081 [Nephila pilipes]|uniref:Uncharacterized protein n=1 Tax=Nephila pilipes TaxID=299642 RepID=A0A8X6NME9_NEPPI|nr:hypothetical protein NPIL_89081 [Nephila pilipes]
MQYGFGVGRRSVSEVVARLSFRTYMHASLCGLVLRGLWMRPDIQSNDIVIKKPLSRLINWLTTEGGQGR